MDTFETTELGSFFVHCSGDKISTNLGCNGFHHTISLGIKSKILDLHRTEDDSKIYPRRKGLFYIRHFTIRKLIFHLKNALPGLLQLGPKIIPVSTLNHSGLTFIRFDEAWESRLFKGGNTKKFRGKIPSNTFDEFVQHSIDLKNYSLSELFIAFRENKSQAEFFGIVITHPRITGDNVLLFKEDDLLSIRNSLAETMKRVIEKEIDPEYQEMLRNELQTLIENSASKS